MILSLEEKANFITHAIGFLLAVAGIYLLLESSWHDPNNWRKLSFIVYGSSLVFLFASSACYHGVTRLEWKRVLRVIDHIAIYLLIAGTYTPFLLGPLRGPWGWSLLVIIWSIAIAGAFLKLWFTGKYERISTALYLGMGWMAIIAIKPMIELVPLPALLWLLAGGLCYTCGVYFYNKTQWRFHHAVWHLFVLAGSGCHFISISGYL